MPPYCGALDGLVVKASVRALDKGNVNLVLPWASECAESEIKAAFDKVIAVRKLGRGEAKDIADKWFFETVVRLHHAGYAPCAGLSTACLDKCPVVPKAEQALEHGSVAELSRFLSRSVESEVQGRFERAVSLKNYRAGDVAAAREYVKAMLDFMLFSHHIYAYAAGSEGEQ